METNKNLEITTVGGGCFWCMEAIFKELKGVEKTVSGYSGGSVPGIPTYKEVCSGLTGHAEVVQVTFDSQLISYEDLLSVFLLSHDPTTLNLKGKHFGSQYRSVIYYHDDSQKGIAKMVIKKLASYYERSITTEISPIKNFHKAEDYHQDYYEKNPEEAYCSAIIKPKLLKLRSTYDQKEKKFNLEMTKDTYGS